MGSTFESVNDSILANFGFTNGSLFSQWDLVANITAMNNYPLSPDNTTLNLTIMANNLVSLSFEGSEGIPWSLVIAERVLNSHHVNSSLHCAHPLSGQYNTLSHSLFHLLIVFSFWYFEDISGFLWQH